MTINAGDLAPAFALADLDGEVGSVTEATAGGPVLVVFLKPSCGSCKTAFPYVERLFQAFHPAATIWGISQDDREKTRRFAQRYGCTFPFLLDGAGLKVSEAFNPTGVPAFYLIGRDGTVQFQAEGFSRVELNRLNAALATATQRPAAALFSPDDPAPAFRPACESKHRLIAAGLLDEE